MFSVLTNINTHLNKNNAEKALDLQVAANHFIFS